jgi:hypothetical protein
MIPSSEAVAENVRRHCEAMAEEIARRCEVKGLDRVLVIRENAVMVLLDWFLGDWVPPHGNSAKLPLEGDSNIPAQGD